MGLFTWIIIGVVILAIIGLGVGTFVAGVWRGADEVSKNPLIEDIKNGTEGIIENSTRELDLRT